MNASKAVGTYGDKISNVIEVWMVMPDDSPRYLCASNDVGEIGEAVNNLYITVGTYMKHPKVKDDLAYIIDSFMDGDIADDPDDDDLPF